MRAIWLHMMSELFVQRLRLETSNLWKRFNIYFFRSKIEYPDSIEHRAHDLTTKVKQNSTRENEKDLSCVFYGFEPAGWREKAGRQWISGVACWEPVAAPWLWRKAHSFAGRGQHCPRHELGVWGALLCISLWPERLNELEMRKTGKEIADMLPMVSLGMLGRLVWAETREMTPRDRRWCGVEDNHFLGQKIEVRFLEDEEFFIGRTARARF